MPSHTYLLYTSLYIHPVSIGCFVFCEIASMDMDSIYISIYVITHRYNHNSG